MKKNTILGLLTAVWCLCISGTLSAQTTVSNFTELRNAMEVAVAGDEIIILPGVYEPSGKIKDAICKFVRFTSDRSGTAENPIILRGSSPTNRPLLQCPDNDIYDGAVMSITGDYWNISDIRVAQGGKGIMLDHANYCTLFNVDVQDVAQEGIHIRTGSSFNIIDSCTVSNTGVIDAGFGEGIYIGTDRASHKEFDPEADLDYCASENKNPYDPDCNRNIVQNCILGPNIRAEHFDIKEGTEYNIVRNCIMDGTGITGANSSDSFLDIKGIYTSVYSNTMTINGNTNINSFIDFNNRMTNSYNYKTGFRNEFFDNTFNTGNLTSVPSATSKGPVSTEIHVFNNTRVPNSPWIKSGRTADATDNYEFRPEWSVDPLLSSDEFESTRFEIYPNPTNETIYISGVNLASVQYSILDLSGKTIQNNVKLENGVIPVTFLTKGTYILQLNANNKTKTNIFIKE